MPLSKSDERRSRSSKGDERLSKMGGSLVFKMGGSWAQRASATEPETDRSVWLLDLYEKPKAPQPGGASLEA